jgi:hypothetical protein
MALAGNLRATEIIYLKYYSLLRANAIKLSAKRCFALQKKAYLRRTLHELKKK